MAAIGRHNFLYLASCSGEWGEIVVALVTSVPYCVRLLLKMPLD